MSLAPQHCLSTRDARVCVSRFRTLLWIDIHFDDDAGREEEKAKERAGECVCPVPRSAPNTGDPRGPYYCSEREKRRKDTHMVEIFERIDDRWGTEI